MGVSGTPAHDDRQGGFTYISLLFVIIVLGVSFSATSHVWSTIYKREKETELLFRGMQIRSAIKSYYDSTPGVKQYPLKLKDLLKDPRQPTTRRHLRRIYPDPMTRKPNWVLVKGPDGRIMGVASASKAVPLKRGNFPEELKDFEGKSKYSDWKFIYAPLSTTTSTTTGGLI